MEPGLEKMPYDEQCLRLRAMVLDSLPGEMASRAWKTIKDYGPMVIQHAVKAFTGVDLGGILPVWKTEEVKTDNA
jgi:hypothetical protein